MTTEQQLDDLVAALPKELTPSLDDWAALSARLALTPQMRASTTSTPIAQTPLLHLVEPRRAVPTDRVKTNAANSGWYWLSGGIAAAAVLAVWLVKPVHQSTNDIAAVNLPAVQQDASVIVRQLKQQREQLLARASQQQLRQLRQVPAGFENWRQQLAIWQQASAQLEQALVQQPANRRLLRQYQQLQRQQLKYMNTLTSLSQAYS